MLHKNPKILWLKNNYLLSLIVFVSQFGSCLGTCHVVAVRGWMGPQSSEGMTTGRGSTPKAFHSHEWQFSAGCWRGALVPLCASTSPGLLQHPHSMAAGL